MKLGAVHGAGVIRGVAARRRRGIRASKYNKPAKLSSAMIKSNKKQQHNSSEGEKRRKIPLKLYSSSFSSVSKVEEAK